MENTYTLLKEGWKLLSDCEFKVFYHMVNGWNLMKDGSDYYFRSLAKLATDTGKSQRTIQRCLNVFEQKGLMVHIRGNSAQNANKYKFTLPNELTIDTNGYSTIDKPDHRTTDTYDQPYNNKNNKKNNIQIEISNMFETGESLITDIAETWDKDKYYRLRGEAKALSVIYYDELKSQCSPKQISKMDGILKTLDKLVIGKKPYMNNTKGTTKKPAKQQEEVADDEPF